MLSPPQHRVVNLTNDIKVSLPVSPVCTSTFVALEKGQWFEAELDWVAQSLEEGYKCVDIGASYGFYSLMMARTVGTAGKVVSFEPDPVTVSHLETSRKINALEASLEVRRKAVCDKAGVMHLALGDSSELNRLVSGAVAEEKTIEVEVTTLDKEIPEGETVDFIKMDCEGAEERVIKGAADLLRRNSPLIMYEVNHAGVMNTSLVQSFQALGYSSYRLVPGLGVLEPYDEADQGHQEFLLNLFAAKDETIEALERRGLAVSAASKATASIPEPTPTLWRAFMASAQYSRRLWGTWCSAPITHEASQALNLYFMSRDPRHSSAVRLQCLQKAHDAMSAFSASSPLVEILNRARCCFDLGLRSTFVKLVGPLIDVTIPPSGSDPPAFFLAPTPQAELDTVHGDGVQQWMRLVAMQQLVDSAFSLSFLPPSERSQLLHILHELVKARYNVAANSRRLLAIEELDKALRGKVEGVATRKAAEIVDRVCSIPEWHDQIELPAGVVTPGKHQAVVDDNLLGFIESAAKGKRVAVLGVNEGYWVLHCLRFGASNVHAVGVGGSANWAALDMCLDLWECDKTKCTQVDAATIYNIKEVLRCEPFDLVLWMEGLNTARHPWLALECIEPLVKSCFVMTYETAEDNTAPFGTVTPKMFIPSVPLVQAALCEGLFSSVVQRPITSDTLAVCVASKASSSE